MRPSMRQTTYVYGVDGLTEWQVLLVAGRAKVKLRFTGGSMSGYGQVPAKFITKNAAIAKIIENSEYFKQGRIRRLIN